MAVSWCEWYLWLSNDLDNWSSQTTKFCMENSLKVYVEYFFCYVVMSVLFADWSSETSSGNNGEITSWVSDLLWAAANKPKKWGMQLYIQNHFWVWDYIYCISVILSVLTIISKWHTLSFLGSKSKERLWEAQ